MRKVLIAEDNPDLRELVAALLEHGGWEVIAAGDGLSALFLYHQALQRGRPFDVLLLDCLMPVLNGIGVGINVRTLEQLGAAPPTKIYYLTGVEPTDQLDALMASGFADGYLCKPFEQQALLKILNSVAGGPSLTEGGLVTDGMPT